MFWHRENSVFCNRENGRDDSEAHSEANHQRITLVKVDAVASQEGTNITTKQQGFNAVSTSKYSDHGNHQYRNQYQGVPTISEATRDHLRQTVPNKSSQQCT